MYSSECKGLECRIYVRGVGVSDSGFGVEIDPDHCFFFRLYRYFQAPLCIWHPHSVDLFQGFGLSV